VAALNIIALKREPEALQAEIESLDNDLGDLAHGRRKVFIESFRSVDESRAQFKGFSVNLEQICADLPRLEESCARFEHDACDIAARHKSNQQTLRQHTQLLELLEIPQLMDTCVRNGLFAEALDIAAHANVLEQRHCAPRLLSGTSSAAAMTSSSSSADGATMIVASVVAEVRRLALQMRESLLRRLSGDIPLPTCLTLISHLQRLYSVLNSGSRKCRRGAATAAGSGSERAGADVGALAEAPRWEIEAEFLQCRETRLLGVLEELPRDNAYQFLMRLVEQSRVHWFDILTQYKAIFFVVEEDAAAAEAANARRARARAASAGDGVGDAGRGKKELRQHLLLSNWVVAKISSLLSTLTRCLPMLTNGQQLAGVLEQSNYFGLSLARVGADFRPYLAPLFESRVIAMMEEQWRAAGVRFSLWMTGGDSGGGDAAAQAMALANAQWPDSFDLAALDVQGDALRVAWRAAAPPPSAGVGDDAVGAEPVASLSAYAPSALAPPTVLLAVPLLAELCNMYLASFNELRLCVRSLPRCEVRLAATLRRALCALVPSLARVRAHLVGADAGSYAPPTVTSAARVKGSDAELVGARLHWAKFDVVCRLAALQVVPYVVSAFASTFQAVSLRTVDGIVDEFRVDMVKSGFSAVFAYEAGAPGIGGDADTAAP
jgi:hypothetical protein